MKILDSLHKLIKINSTALIVTRFDVSKRVFKPTPNKAFLDAGDAKRQCALSG